MSKEVKVIKSLSKEEFIKLFEKYYLDLVFFISLKTKDRNIAIELTNTLFINLQECLDKFNPKKGDFKTWLFTCSKNLYLDYQRSTLKHQEFFCEINEDIEIESYFINKEEDLKISDLEDILTQEEYQYIILDYVLDFKKQEISSIMNISDSTRKRIKKSAMFKIKVYVKEVLSK